MTISTTVLRADANGNGTTTAFTANFKILDQTHILVLRTQISTGIVTTLALTTDYTVSGVGGNSFTVTCVVAPTTDQRISILRNTPLTQLTSYVANDPFPAASHENALDQLTTIAQQQNETISRALSLPQNSTGVSTVLPVPSANALIGWNTTATALQNYAGTPSVTVSSAMAPVVQAATLAAARTNLGAMGGADIQGQTSNAATTTGTPPAYVAALSPAITALVANKTRVNLTFASGNAGPVATTLDIGTGAIALKQYAFDGTKVDPTITAGMVGDVVYDGTSLVLMNALPPAASIQIQSIPTPTFSAGAMTIPSQVFKLDFRNSSLTSGATTPAVSATAAALVVPSGATLGTTSAVQADLYLLELFPSAGVIEHSLINKTADFDLSEAGLISTTAISGASNSANIAYSTTARTNVPYRTIGLYRGTQTIGGTWAQAMTLIQGAGGEGLGKKLYPPGSAPVYGARAWCRANGGLVGTNAPDAGGNIASVTRNSTGSYRATFVTPMPDALYSAIGIASANGALLIIQPVAQTATYFDFNTNAPVDGVLRDSNPFFLAFFR